MSQRNRRLVFVLGTVILVSGVVFGLVRGCGHRRQVIHVATADALAMSFVRMVEVFERENPDVEVRLNVEGSVMLLRMHLLHPSDVVAFADHRLIEEVLRPDDAHWLAKFATTEIVVASSQGSKFVAEITTENWPEVLLRPGVRVGHPDPATDSCGYYTRLAWKLASRHHAARFPDLFEKLVEKSSAKYQRPDALGVMALVETRSVDYAFLYRCHAVDHHLPYIRLADQENLGLPSLAATYAQASVDVPDFKGKVVPMQGHPIFFGLTISRRSRKQEIAERFVRFVLSFPGQEILRRSDIVPLVPAQVPAWSTHVPQSLTGIVVAEPASLIAKPGVLGP
jgi:molybdate/tungstate transport system substrate-binding protein